MGSVACRIFLDWESNLCLLHWQVESSPLSHQGSQLFSIFNVTLPFFSFFCTNCSKITLIKRFKDLLKISPDIRCFSFCPALLETMFLCIHNYYTVVKQWMSSHPVDFPNRCQIVRQSVWLRVLLLSWIHSPGEGISVELHSCNCNLAKIPGSLVQHYLFHGSFLGEVQSPDGSKPFTVLMTTMKIGQLEPMVAFENSLSSKF